MTLGQQIQATIQNFRENLPPEMNSLIEQGAGEISALTISENAAKQGDTAPNFTLSDRQGNQHSLTDYLKQGPVVLTFYRGAWCPYCNLQLAAYNKRIDEIRGLGATLIALTPEQADGIDALNESNFPQKAKDAVVLDPDFPVLHDKNSEVGQKFGLTFELPESHKKLFELFNLSIEKTNGGSSYTFSDPATFIIDQNQVIRWAFVPNNYRKRAEPEAIIQQLQAIQGAVV